MCVYVHIAHTHTGTFDLAEIRLGGIIKESVYYKHFVETTLGWIK